MPTSAAGNEVKGFTLLELMVVVAIVALASVGVTLSLRDSAQAQLDTEAQRLAALLESARAQSRTVGVPVTWRPTATGFVFEGLPAARENSTAPMLPSQWQNTDVSASVTRPVLLGPEPLIPPQRVRLWMTAQPERVLWVATDGVRPFAVQAEGAASAAPAAGALP
jgi:general secretion pathway protein H